ncbi:MAG: prepilin-type N-terminal cleavage/methylation domain-containing protein [Opitutales bacterium]
MRRGFTLLESLISLALLSVLMVTLNSFLFSMGELWGEGRDRRLFEQHVRAATRQVRETFDAATLGPGASGVVMKMARDDGAVDEPRLSFHLPDAGRLADWPEAPLPDVDFTLHVEEGRGLVLRWQSRLEIERDLNDVHETVLSPFVDGLSYDYFDPQLKTWTTEEEPKRNSSGSTLLQPARIRIHFARGALEAERTIDLPLRRTGISRP